MLATYPQSCAYKSVITSDNGGATGITLNSPPRARWTFREFVFSVLLTALLFCSEIGKPALRSEEIDYEAVASRLVLTSQVPYRAPLRLVVRRKPVGFFRHPDRMDLGEYNIGVYIREVLECGHQLEIVPHDLEPLIARRRRCQECLDAEALPLKKPVRSAKPEAESEAA